MRVPTITLGHLTEKQWQAYAIADNALGLEGAGAGWDVEILAEELKALQQANFDLTSIGFDTASIDSLLGGFGLPGGSTQTKAATPATGSLTDRFMVAPFSVLNAREGWWQNRKRLWIELGIQSELGRGENALDTSAALAGVTDPAEIEAWNARRRFIGANTPHDGHGMADGLVAVRARQKAANAAPGGSPPAADYSERQRGDGKGRAAAFGTRQEGQGTSGDRVFSATRARTFAQDIVKGESAIPADGLGPGTRRRKANARTSGGGGGYINPGQGGSLTAAMRNAPAQNAARQALATPHGAIGAQDDTSRRNSAGGPAARAVGTQDWVQGKIAEGDIAGGMASGHSGTSIFDPVLTELAYRWFCPPGGVILDPFAGGSVRGIVASRLGRSYYGVDLRPEQCEANRAQADHICAGKFPPPQWLAADSRDTHTFSEVAADFVFSCPPYGDLEVYSEDERDLSTMALADFLEAYFLIVARSIDQLKPDRFACFVVGDYRDTEGFYCDFVGSTVEAFERAGAWLYNEAILVTAAGSLPIRAGKQFATSRKLGKTHQNILVFCKGDPRKATAACGPVDVSDDIFEAALAEAAEDVERL